MRHAHHWSVAQANALRPFVGEWIGRLRDARDQLAEHAPPPSVAALAMVGGGAWPGRAHAAAAVELVLGSAQLERLDIIVRDLDAGLVDFPALRDGEEVYLCWVVGEPEVGHWHAPDAGFPGRQPL
jgi:Uncharacterized conserved protein (DUF2203)